MMNVTVRPARPEDDTAVGELLVDAYVTAYARKMPQVTLSAQRLRDLRAVAPKRAAATVLVATWHDEVVGTVALWRPDAPGSEAWRPNAADLRHLAVAPHLHGQGLSGALLDETEALARGWRCDAICLHVRAGNAGVAELYRSRGYVRDTAGDVAYPDVTLEGYALELRGQRAPSG